MIDHDRAVLDPSAELLELHRQLRGAQAQDALFDLQSGDPS